jgi:hypothetical protein
METKKPAMLDISQFYLQTIGQDSEFFLWDAEKSEVVPSFKYFPKKAEAKVFNYSGNYGLTAIHSDAFRKNLAPKYSQLSPKCTSGTYTIFRDGLAVEINTPPVACREHFWNCVRFALVLADSMIPEGDQVSFTDRPWVEVSPALRKTFPSDVLELGCNPTLDAYTQSEKVIEVDPVTLGFRTSGSHLHMGLTDDHDNSIPQELWAPFIKVADLILGVPFTFLFNDSLEFKRRKLYGQAGEFRFQTYTKGKVEFERTGLEYRVLSSRLWSHVGLGSLFSGIWKYVMGNGKRLKPLFDSWDSAWEDDIREAINTGNEAALTRAMKLMSEHFPKPVSYFQWSEDNPLPGISDHKLSPDDMLGMWKKLKAAKEKGEFLDVAPLNMNHPNGTLIGWREYSSELRSTF